MFIDHQPLPPIDQIHNNNNIMTAQKIPTVILATQPPVIIEDDTPASSDALCSLVWSDARGLGDDDTATHTKNLIRQDQESREEEITAQDLQAMKQMIREIRQRPQLLYEYSPVFWRLVEMKRMAAFNSRGGE